MAILRVESACKFFGGLKAVNQVSFEVKENCILGLIGPNGSGKTTMFNLISGVRPVTSGKIYFNNKDITKLKPHARTDLGIARTFQGNRIFKKMSVVENIMIACQCHTDISFAKEVLSSKANKQIDEANIKKAEELIELVGISGYKDYKAGDLPFALQAAMGIANALATQPKLLLLDEPMAGMNQSEAETMLELIRKIQSLGITILLVEHNMRAVMNISDRIVVLNDGIKIAEGLPAEIANNPEVISAYLGGVKLA